MKKIVLFVMLSASTGSLQASEGGVVSAIVRNLCFDKKLVAAISSLNSLLGEMKNKHIEYLNSKVVSDYYRGNTRYITTDHYYAGNGNVIDTVGRYEKALTNLNQTNMILAAGDGALLGVCVSIIGKMFKLNDKTSGIGLVICSALLTLAKNKHIGKVPYLSYPKLTPESNFFGIGNSIATFCVIAGAGAAGYFGTNFLVDAVSGKMSGINDALKVSNA